jgi:serine/threonine protein kinase
MGEVYRARDPRLGRTVAIKVLPASVSADASRRHRFEHEARTTGLLNHPNILVVYDVGDYEGAPYLVTELLEGETLRERLRAGAIPPRKAVDYALQAAHGLAAAHDKAVVHRDLKPENLFVTKDGVVKILDFGLALQEAVTDSGDTRSPTLTRETGPGVVLGTVGYMSPEQARGETADHRSDIFALGAVLYEMLTGRRAFHGETAVETLNAS